MEIKMETKLNVTQIDILSRMMVGAKLVHTKTKKSSKWTLNGRLIKNAAFAWELVRLDLIDRTDATTMTATYELTSNGIAEVNNLDIREVPVTFTVEEAYRMLRTTKALNDYILRPLDKSFNIVGIQKINDNSYLLVDANNPAGMVIAPTDFVEGYYQMSKKDVVA